MRASHVMLIASALALGIGGGWFIGAGMASSRASSDEREAERVSKEETTLREERQRKAEAVDELEQNTKSMPDAATTGALRASGTTTANVKPATKFSVDGGDYVVHGVQVVDSFDSQDRTRPADKLESARWVLVDVTYTNRTSESESPACGVLKTIQLITSEGLVLPEVKRDPPVHPETYGTCAKRIEPGRSGRWLAPVQVPEETVIDGVLVANSYARMSGSEYEVVRGKAAWLRLDEPLEVGAVGDEEQSLAWDDVAKEEAA